MNKEYNKWLNSQNVNKEDKNKLQKMNKKEITFSFGSSLNFGTAGIRSHMGLGTSLLNKYVIKMITYAWIKSLEKTKSPNLKKGIIIARDSRKNGKEFSEVAARVISGMGYKVIMFDKNNIQPTPIISFTIKDLQLGGGACITASHNPPQFNGFKCFTNEGQHLMPRNADLIAKELLNLDINTKIPESDEKIEFLNKDYENYYIKSIMNVIKINKKLRKNLKIVFSPQHGASYKLGPLILRKTGFNVFEVKNQSYPDENFTNTLDPNPENPLAFNEMKVLGKKIGAELLLTTDPDGDRVAIGILHKNKYHLLNGHEMAVILVNYFLEKMAKQQTLTKTSYIIKTFVTTSLIDQIAKKYKVKLKNTLTGFKNIGEIIRTSKTLPIMATEESYGSSLCPSLSLDKDALQLLPVIAELTTTYFKKGKTLLDVLEDIYKEHGYYIQKNEKVELKGSNADSKLQKLMEFMAKVKKIGGLHVVKIEDFRKKKLAHKKSNLVIVHFQDKSWIAVRPSGTEFLIRQYFCIIDKSKEQVMQKFIKIRLEFNKHVKNYMR